MRPPVQGRLCGGLLTCETRDFRVRLVGELREGQEVPGVKALRGVPFTVGVTVEQDLPMNVSLTPELEQFVSAKVETGRYNSASEVVREALRLLEEHDQARASQLAGFNRQLGRRLASLDRGEHVDPKEARARIESQSQERRKKRR